MNTQTINKNSMEGGDAALELSRRRLLLVALCGGIAVSVWKLSSMLFGFLTPPAPKGAFGGLVSAGSLETVGAVNGPPQPFPRAKFWLVHGDNGITAVHNGCTHLQCLFSWDEEKQLFVCPCHGSQFTREGRVLNGPAERDLDTFCVRLVDGEGKIIRQSAMETAEPLPVSDLLERLQQQEKERAEQVDGVSPSPAVIGIVVDTGRMAKGRSRAHQS